MSYTTSAMLSRGQCSIAIVGATGRLGYPITEILLTTFKPFFSRVVALTRDATSSRAVSLASMGADVCRIRLDDSELNDGAEADLLRALEEIDVVVNVLGVTSVRMKDAVAAAAIEAGAKVYFPSEFGVDHRLNNFPGFDHEEWVKKRKHLKYTNELATKKGSDVKIIAVYTGLFLEDSLTPQFGFDVVGRKITTFGPASAKVTFTSKRDVACSVAQLAILAMLSPTSLADNVQSHVRIAGCTRSVDEIARVLRSVLCHRQPGEVDIKVDEVDIAKAREKLKEDYEAGAVGAPAGYIRVLMGEGKLDFSKNNSNELVNPHERMWSWKTVEEVTRSFSSSF